MLRSQVDLDAHSNPRITSLQGMLSVLSWQPTKLEITLGMMPASRCRAPGSLRQFFLYHRMVINLQ